MTVPLQKYPGEAKQYTFEFANAALASTTARGTTWAQALLGSGEAFQPALTLPLCMSLIVVTPAPTIVVARSDGGSNDLTLGTAVPSGTHVTMVISGGTAGLSYAITVEMTTNESEILACQGVLQVTNTLV